MADNVLIKLVQEIPVEYDSLTTGKVLMSAFDVIKRIYSYIVTKKNNKYIVQCNISQNDDYNTIDVNPVIIHIVKSIYEKDYHNDGAVICFKQPDIELLLQMYDPLVNKLAYQQKEHWKHYDIEDLCQICRLVMITLYRKGYYLHKRLIEKSFINELLIEMRKDKYKPNIVSLNDVFYKPVSASEDLTFADIISDDDPEEKEKEERIKEAEHLIFEEVKDIIIDLIGERQWNEFYRDYANKHTTAWSRKTLLKIKNHLNSLGLTRGKFNDKYYK